MAKDVETIVQEIEENRKTMHRGTIREKIWQAIIDETLSTKEKISIINLERNKDHRLLMDEWVTSQIANILSKETKYHEEILCLDLRPKGINNKYTFGYDTSGVNEFLVQLLDGAAEQKIINMGPLNNEQSQFDRSIFGVSGIAVKPRYEVEHNPYFKQFVVGVIVLCQTENGFEMMLLQNTPSQENRIPSKKTMVQGHVSYDETTLSYSLMDWLKESAFRELTEEIDITDLSDTERQELRGQLTIGHMIYDECDTVGREHLGFIFQTIVSKDVFDKMSSGEPDKHELCRLPLENGKPVELDNTFDNWSTMVINLWNNNTKAEI